jgi:chromate reductase
VNVQARTNTPCRDGGPRLLLVAGSQRAESLNARLLDNIARRLKDNCDVDLLLPSQVDLPLLNQDLETHADVLARVASVHRRFSASHGLIVATPEYNGQLPPYLKNVIDWVSRLHYIDPSQGNPFIDRPVLLCSASTGWSGGSLAIPHARALFGYVGGVVIGDTICVPQASQVWTGDGYAFGSAFDAQIDAALARVARLASEFANALEATLS